MDINEMSKIMTREDFLEEVVGMCPNNFGLNNDNCEDFIECSECRECAIKDIQFKDEKEKQESKWVFNIEEYNNEDIVINCEKENEADKLFEILKDYDLPKGKQNHNEKTCYRFDKKGGLYQGDCRYYKENGYAIYKFSEIDFNQVYTKEYIGEVSLTNNTDEFDITKAKYITRKQLDKRGFKNGDILFLSNKQYGLVIYDSISYLDAKGFDLLKTIQSITVGIIPIENQKTIAGYISWFIQDRLYDNIKPFVIPIQEETKQKTICKVEFVVGADNLRDFILEDDEEVTEGEIVEVHTGGNYQYAKVKEVAKESLTENEILLYKTCRKLSSL